MNRSKTYRNVGGVLVGVLAVAVPSVFVLQSRDEPVRTSVTHASETVAAGKTEDPGAGRVGGAAPETWPSWGFTHTQNERNAPIDALSRQPLVQAQALMGWGADNPEPAKGRYDWGSLDRRIDLIRRSKGTPVITLCGAPDWMKGGQPGRTDWSRLEVAPRPEHFDDFAALAAQTARRYPDVKHFTVWNEFKGFWNQRLNRWDYEGYTRLYNKVYTALKKVNPEIQVGGPYMVMNSNATGSTAVKGKWGSVDKRSLEAVRYWFEHKKGADFVAVDGHSFPEQRNVRPDEFVALGKFSAITKWLRGLDAKLPVWWAEWYVEPDRSLWTAQHRHAVHAAALMEFAQGGAATALYWNPGNLWANGRTAPALELLQNFTTWFPPGTALRKVTATPAKVRVLAQSKKMVVVNTSAQAVEASVDGRSVRLAPYAVRWFDR